MSRSKGASVVVMSAVLVVLAAGLLTAIGILGFPSTANADEKLYLEAVSDPGENPFVPAAGLKVPVTGPAVDGKTGITVETTECDPAALVAHLEGDPRLAAAWTGALNSDPTLRWAGGTQVRPDQVRAYIAELTPQRLSRDLRVTNFQYTKGAPTSVQSVLQSGSSVLVDQAGVVRVRCKCGNPLTPMKQLTAAPVYQGKKWEGFVEIVVVARCDPDQRWDGDRCRDIDCRDGYYYDGGACRPVKCDDDEQLRDGHCRPIDCDRDDGRQHDRCDPPRCPEDTNYDGHRCEPPRCPDGEYQSGRDCQRPECPDGEVWQHGSCTEPDCPDGDTFTGTECAPDPCADAQGGAPDGADCTPPCETGFAWSADARACTPAEKATPPECPDGATPEQCATLTTTGPDGTAARNGQQPTDGTTPGTTDGTTPGTTDGTTPGTTDGTTPGTTDGTTPGSTDGTTPGTTDGTTPGTTDGTTAPGTTDGTTPGTTDGTTAPGTTDGTTAPGTTAPGGTAPGGTPQTGGTGPAGGVPAAGPSCPTIPGLLLSDVRCPKPTGPATGPATGSATGSPPSGSGGGTGGDTGGNGGNGDTGDDSGSDGNGDGGG